MATWKLNTDSEALFYHLCSDCTERSAESLLQAGWKKIRDNEPVSCNECTRKCVLTSNSLWAADEETRYAVCAKCAELSMCPLKGRYFC